MEQVLALKHNPTTDTYTVNSVNADEEEIEVTVKPGHFLSPKRNSFNKKVFPDSGASICLGGTQHLKQLGMLPQELIPCNKRIAVVGGATLPCLGFIFAEFVVNGVSTKQKLYICDQIDRIFFSKAACIDTFILPSTFPKPLPTLKYLQQQDTSPLNHNAQPFNPSVHSAEVMAVNTQQPPKRILGEGNRRIPPPRPKRIPHPPVESSIPVLRKYIVDHFRNSALDRSPPFPKMNTTKGHIHLKPDAVPFAVHSPIPVPHHEKDTVKAMLDLYVEKGIITPVPHNTPTVWCALMVLGRKKDGTPRITVDFQHLNKQCFRETHHTEPPFHLASRVPPNTKKTVLDATDSYHSVELDEESQPLTTFITEWGRFMYLRVPQGFFAAGDIFTRRYDDIIKDVDNKVKIVDDTLLHANNIEQSFWDTWDYLTLCAENGITINEEKLQFCLDEVEFAGLTINNDGITPAKSILAAISDFPEPTDLTSARSWFGLVNQVSWAYSNHAIMEPFRDLIKPNRTFYWDKTLTKLFETSKQQLLGKIRDGVKSFELGRRTALQTDWCKHGIGYLLLQKHCSCADKNNVRCCPEGWKLIYAGSRFTKDAETRYKPTEGEALAIAWGLEHSRMFTLGCSDLLISTDHKPLLGIFKDRDLHTIKNPRIQNFKESTLAWRFEIAYNPGKWHKGPDAVSRQPSPLLAVTLQTAASTENTDKIEDMPGEERILSAGLTNLYNAASSAVSLEDIRTEGQRDQVYSTLIKTIQEGFPSSKAKLDSQLREFWEVRERLFTQDNVVYLDQRVVIPSKLRKLILESLHSANQGVSGMRRRANATVYWPRMSSTINNYRVHCNDCQRNAPSQPAEPIILSPSPEWPFQQVCMDYFFIGAHAYLVVVDRYSGWPSVFHFRPGQTTAKHLLSALRNHFATFGIPEESSSDGGPQFESQTFKTFLRTWGIDFRLSSVGYAQSNGRAEVGVKTMKRLLHNNISPDGSLDNDKVLTALLEYRNTPLPDIDLSPAQILFQRQLRDGVPTHRNQYRLHKQWILAADERERLYAKKNQAVIQRYNKNTRALSELSLGTPVLIQDKRKKWSKQGIIVEALKYRQYRVKVSGSGRCTLQNRRFLRPYHAPHSSSTATATVPTVPQNTLSPQYETVEIDRSNTTEQSSPPDSIVPVITHQPPPPSPTEQSPPTQPQPEEDDTRNNLTNTSVRIPRSLKNLETYNSPGLREHPVQPGGRR